MWDLVQTSAREGTFQKREFPAILDITYIRRFSHACSQCSVGSCRPAWPGWKSSNFRGCGLKTTPISVLDCNTSTLVASTGNLPPPFLTLAYNPYRLPEMDLAFRLAIFWTNLGNACTVILHILTAGATS